MNDVLSDELLSILISEMIQTRKLTCTISNLYWIFISCTLFLYMIWNIIWLLCVQIYYGIWNGMFIRHTTHMAAKNQSRDHGMDSF